MSEFSEKVNILQGRFNETFNRTVKCPVCKMQNRTGLANHQACPERDSGSAPDSAGEILVAAKQSPGD
jgi:hypothetical protein